MYFVNFLPISLRLFMYEGVVIFLYCALLLFAKKLKQKRVICLKCNRLKFTFLELENKQEGWFDCHLCKYDCSVSYLQYIKRNLQ